MANYDEGEVANLCDAFDRGEYVDLSHSDVSAVFEVLRQYFDQLPSPLCVYSVYGEIQRASGIAVSISYVELLMCVASGQQGKPQTETILYRILPAMPLTNWTVLKCLCAFLFELSQPLLLSSQSHTQIVVDLPQPVSPSYTSPRQLSPSYSADDAKKLNLQTVNGTLTKPFPSPRSISLPLPTSAPSPSPTPSPLATPRSAPGSQLPSPAPSPRGASQPMDVSINALARIFGVVLIKRREDQAQLSPEDLKKKQDRAAVVVETLIEQHHFLFAEHL